MHTLKFTQNRTFKHCAGLDVGNVGNEQANCMACVSKSVFHFNLTQPFIKRRLPSFNVPVKYEQPQ